MGAKHQLKLFLREAYARVLFHTGLCALVDRIAPRRLSILAGHCVTADSNATLAKDMRIEGAKLERILRNLGRRHELTTVNEGWRSLHSPGRRSLVALSMDDGYKDNRTHLLPLLQRVGAPATVYLETAALDERALNWSHLFFWLLDRLGPVRFVERFTAECRDARTNELYRELLASSRATSYHLKRVLKYEAPAAERTRAIRALFLAEGGDERALCDALYMTWDDARALRDAGVELGGHTVHHEILSRLDEHGQRAEVGGARASLVKHAGDAPASFAYPFGRRWDYDERSKDAARLSGFTCATTTHAGVNQKGSDPWALKRLMIDEDARLHVLATEACGGFELLRRVGLDLSE